MEIFDKIGEVASQTYKFTAEKADQIARETKIKIKMNENKAKIEKLYNEIGEAVYRKHISKSEENFNEQIENACKEIDNISKEIEQQNNELLSMKDKKQCPNCHDKIEKESRYCPNCGMEQTEDNKDKEPEEEGNAISTQATEEEKADDNVN